MDVLVDMNLSPRWVEFLEAGGYEVKHWTTVGDADAPDRALIQWAEERGCVLPTNDLSGLILQALRQFESELEEGAILSVDVDRF